MYVIVKSIFIFHVPCKDEIKLNRTELFHPREWNSWNSSDRFG